MSRRFAAQGQLNFSGEGRARFKKLPGIAEREISGPVKRLLALHKNVAIGMRINTGAGFLIDSETMQKIMAALGGKEAFDARFGRRRWMEFATPGCPDYLGLLKDGRFLALEVKRPGYGASAVTPEQRSFLDLVNRNGGLGFLGSDLARIEAILSGRVEPEDRGGFLA